MRIFEPLKPDHPIVGTPCWHCKRPFASGDHTTLIPTVPADEEEAAKARAGRAFTAQAYPMHADCARARGYTLEESPGVHYRRELRGPGACGLADASAWYTDRPEDATCAACKLAIAAAKETP